MDLNSNLTTAQRVLARDYHHNDSHRSNSILAPQSSTYFNVSNYAYNIVTNRAKQNRVSMPALVREETRANRMRTFLAYWNNENFFDPLRNGKKKFDTPPVFAKKRSDPEVIKYAQTTPLPVIRVVAANRTHKCCKF